MSLQTHLHWGKMVTGKVKDELWRLEHGCLSSVHFNLYESITVLPKLPAEQVGLTLFKRVSWWTADVSTGEEWCECTEWPKTQWRHRKPMLCVDSRWGSWMAEPAKKEQTSSNLHEELNRGGCYEKKKSNPLANLQTVEQYPVNTSACNFSVHPSFIYLILLLLSCF